MHVTEGNLGQLKMSWKIYYKWFGQIKSRPMYVLINNSPEFKHQEQRRWGVNRKNQGERMITNNLIFTKCGPKQDGIEKNIKIGDPQLICY